MCGRMSVSAVIFVKLGDDSIYGVFVASAGQLQTLVTTTQSERSISVEQVQATAMLFSFLVSTMSFIFQQHLQTFHQQVQVRRRRHHHPLPGLSSAAKLLAARQVLHPSRQIDLPNLATFLEGFLFCSGH